MNIQKFFIETTIEYSDINFTFILYTTEIIVVVVAL